jgi:flavin-dependent dehydrogenase
MWDIVVIGGGLAGLTSAIHLRKLGYRILLVEKKDFPRHKVCGEYISSEVEPYFESLDLDLSQIQANQVDRFQLYAPSGRFVESPLELGGRGIRRYTLDNYLYEAAKTCGVEFALKTAVQEVERAGDGFQVRTQKGSAYLCKVVLGAYGKRSGVDRQLERSFMAKEADYVGVKFYVDLDFPADLVTLYNFPGGYAGAVQVEDGTVDIAYLCSARQLRRYRSIARLEEELLFQNPAIQGLFCGGERTPSQPYAISNVTFLPKKQVVSGVLMLGDAAGMIPPLAGNGMAMAIHAAKIAGECTHRFLKGEVSRDTFEKDYQKQWRRQFAQRLFWGRRLHRFMGKPQVSEWAVRTLQTFPVLLPPIIKQTHGAPIRV